MTHQIAQTNRLFISYAHVDNRLFDDAVASFAENLKGFYSTKTGNELSVFFDRESIGWGDNWRGEIDGELQNAAIFMPVITMQYFNRPACRDELNAFYSSAKRLDARYLILPVVISGAKSISSSHPIPEVGIIEALQYRNLEDVFLAGPGTSEWRRALSHLTDELIELVAKAESAALTMTPSGLELPDGEDGEESEDFLSLVATLEDLAPQVEREVEIALEDLQSWSEIMGSMTSSLTPNKSIQQMRNLSIAMADKIRTPSERLHDSGIQLAASTAEADAAINAMLGHLSRVQTKEAKEAANNIIESAGSGTSELSTVISQMSEFLNVMTMMEVMSAPLRKAIKPARVGITKIQDAVRIVERWGTLSQG